MKYRKDGGPAFPQPITPEGNTVEDEFGEGGMSLRDYFAAAALQGMFANPSLITIAKEGKQVVAKFNQSNIHEAYLSADAMLAEREKP